MACSTAVMMSRSHVVIEKDQGVCRTRFRPGPMLQHPRGPLRFASAKPHLDEPLRQRRGQDILATKHAAFGGHRGPAETCSVAPLLLLPSLPLLASSDSRLAQPRRDLVRIIISCTMR